MKVVQEENIQTVETQLNSRYQIDSMSCLFFVLGMLMCAFILHTFIL